MRRGGHEREEMREMSEEEIMRKRERHRERERERERKIMNAILYIVEKSIVQSLLRAST